MAMDPYSIPIYERMEGQQSNLHQNLPSASAAPVPTPVLPPTIAPANCSPTHSATYARTPALVAAENNTTGRRLSWPRPGSNPNRRASYRIGCESEEDVLQNESVDLLRMLPESQRVKDTNTLRSLAANATTTRSRTRLFQREDESEDSSGLYDEAVLYYNSVCGNHSNREPERIAFLSRSYSALDSNKKRNNNQQQSAAMHDCRNRPVNVAEYCTSKSHSKSCGNLTCPRFDKNRLSRSLKQIYPEHKSKKRKHLKKFKRWAFIAAILLGIVLAITGIVVAFLVFAPLRMGVHHCKIGYIWCGKAGCISPGQLCSRAADCPGPIYEAVCHQNKTDSRDPSKGSIPTFTLSPLLRNSDSVYEEDPAGWVHFGEGSTNGSRYVIINRAMTFSGGQEACRGQGGHLVHIGTVREQVFLQEYLERELKRVVFPSDTIGFWIGARRARGSHTGSCMYNQWRWTDFYGRTFGTIAGFAAFVPDKPDNYYAPEECLYMSINNGHHPARYLKWDDAPCDIHGIGGIMPVCEVENRVK